MLNYKLIQNSMIFKCSETQLSIQDKVLCDKVSLIINQGDCIRLCGQNGVGKTLLSQAILGLNDTLKSIDYSNIVGKETVYITDSPFFLDNDTVLSVLLTHKLFYRISLDQSFKIGDLLGIDLHSIKTCKISSLSFGMQKKLTLIPLFLENQNMFVLDEIFTGIDVMTQRLLIDRIVSISKLNLTIIFIEHNENIAESIASQTDVKEILCNQKEIKS